MRPEFPRKKRRGLHKAIRPYKGGRRRCKVCGFRIRGSRMNHEDGEHHRRALK